MSDFRGRKRGRGSYSWKNYRPNPGNLFNQNNPRSNFNNFQFNPIPGSSNFRPSRWPVNYVWRSPPHIPSSGNVKPPQIRYMGLPPMRQPFTPRRLLPTPPNFNGPLIRTRPPSPLPGSEEARQKAIAEASARIKEQLFCEPSSSIPSVQVRSDNDKSDKTINQPKPLLKTPEQSKKKTRQKTPRKTTVNKEELRTKIVKEISTMSKGKLQSLINNPGFTKYDAALQHLLRDARLNVSSELRTLYNNRSNDNEQITSVVPDLGVDIALLPDTLVDELSNILELDLNDPETVIDETPQLIEPEQLFKQAELMLSNTTLTDDPINFDFSIPPPNMFFDHQLKEEPENSIILGNQTFLNNCPNDLLSETNPENSLLPDANLIEQCNDDELNYFLDNQNIDQFNVNFNCIINDENIDFTDDQNVNNFTSPPRLLARTQQNNQNLVSQINNLRGNGNDAAENNQQNNQISDLNNKTNNSGGKVNTTENILENNHEQFNQNILIPNEMPSTWNQTEILTQMKNVKIQFKMLRDMNKTLSNSTVFNDTENNSTKTTKLNKNLNNKNEKSEIENQRLKEIEEQQNKEKEIQRLKEAENERLKEEEKRRKDEEIKQKEEEKKRREEEKLRKIEEEEKLRLKEEEEKRKQKEEKIRQEEERKKNKEEERLKQKDEEERRKRKEEERSRQREEERSRQREEDRSRQREEDRSRHKEDQRLRHKEENRSRHKDEDRFRHKEDERSKHKEDERFRHKEEGRLRDKDEDRIRHKDTERIRQKENERSRQNDRWKQKENDKQRQRDSDKHRYEKNQVPHIEKNKEIAMTNETIIIQDMTLMEDINILVDSDSDTKTKKDTEYYSMKEMLSRRFNERSNSKSSKERTDSPRTEDYYSDSFSEITSDDLSDYEYKREEKTEHYRRSRSHDHRHHRKSRKHRSNDHSKESDKTNLEHDKKYRDMEERVWITSDNRKKKKHKHQKNFQYDNYNITEHNKRENNSNQQQPHSPKHRSTETPTEKNPIIISIVDNELPKHTVPLEERMKVFKETVDKRNKHDTGWNASPPKEIKLDQLQENIKNLVGTSRRDESKENPKEKTIPKSKNPLNSKDENTILFNASSVPDIKQNIYEKTNKFFREELLNFNISKIGGSTTETLPEPNKKTKPTTTLTKTIDISPLDQIFEKLSEENMKKSSPRKFGEKPTTTKKIQMNSLDLRDDNSKNDTIETTEIESECLNEKSQTSDLSENLNYRLKSPDFCTDRLKSPDFDKTEPFKSVDTNDDVRDKSDLSADSSKPNPSSDNSSISLQDKLKPTDICTDKLSTNGSSKDKSKPIESATDSSKDSSVDSTKNVIDSSVDNTKDKIKSTDSVDGSNKSESTDIKSQKSQKIKLSRNKNCDLKNNEVGKGNENKQGKDGKTNSKCDIEIVKDVTIEKENKKEEFLDVRNKEENNDKKIIEKKNNSDLKNGNDNNKIESKKSDKIDKKSDKELEIRKDHTEKKSNKESEKKSESSKDRLKKSEKDSIKKLDDKKSERKESDQKHDKESDRKLDKGSKKSNKESDKRSDLKLESEKKSDKESDKKISKEPDKKSSKESDKKSDKETDKKVYKKSENDKRSDSEKKSEKESDKKSSKNSEKRSETDKKLDKRDFIKKIIQIKNSDKKSDKENISNAKSELESKKKDDKRSETKSSIKKSSSAPDIKYVDKIKEDDRKNRKSDKEIPDKINKQTTKNIKRNKVDVKKEIDTNKVEDTKNLETEKKEKKTKEVTKRVDGKIKLNRDSGNKNIENVALVRNKESNDQVKNDEEMKKMNEADEKKEENTMEQKEMKSLEEPKILESKKLEEIVDKKIEKELKNDDHKESSEKCENTSKIPTNKGQEIIRDVGDQVDDVAEEINKVTEEVDGITEEISDKKLSNKVDNHANEEASNIDKEVNDIFTEEDEEPLSKRMQVKKSSRTRTKSVNLQEGPMSSNKIDLSTENQTIVQNNLSKICDNTNATADISNKNQKPPVRNKKLKIDTKWKIVKDNLKKIKQFEETVDKISGNVTPEMKTPTRSEDILQKIDALLGSDNESIKDSSPISTETDFYGFSHNSSPNTESIQTLIIPIEEEVRSIEELEVRVTKTRGYKRKKTESEDIEAKKSKPEMSEEETIIERKCLRSRSKNTSAETVTTKKLRGKKNNPIDSSIESVETDKNDSDSSEIDQKSKKRKNRCEVLNDEVLPKEIQVLDTPEVLPKPKQKITVSHALFGKKTEKKTKTKKRQPTRESDSPPPVLSPEIQIPPQPLPPYFDIPMMMPTMTLPPQTITSTPKSNETNKKRSKEEIINRMMIIDIEIQKLMQEKLDLYKELQTATEIKTSPKHETPDLEESIITTIKTEMIDLTTNEDEEKDIEKDALVITLVEEACSSLGMTMKEPQNDSSDLENIPKINTHNYDKDKINLVIETVEETPKNQNEPLDLQEMKRKKESDTENDDDKEIETVTKSKNRRKQKRTNSPRKRKRENRKKDSSTEKTPTPIPEIQKKPTKRLKTESICQSDSECSEITKNLRSRSKLLSNNSPVPLSDRQSSVSRASSEVSSIDTELIEENKKKTKRKTKVEQPNENSNKKTKNIIPCFVQLQRMVLPTNTNDKPNDQSEVTSQSSKTPEDECLIVSSTSDSTVVAEKDPLEDGIFCTAHTKSILDLKVFGDEFLAASEDGSIYRYCLKTGKLNGLYLGHMMAVTCLYIPKDNDPLTRVFFSGSLDCSLKCYKMESCELVQNITIEQAIQCMDSAWGYIFLGTYDGLLFIYDIKRKRLHENSITVASATVLMVRATTEGSRQVLILASRKREIMVRDAFTGLLLRTMCEEQKPTIYSLLLERSFVYCGTSDKGILILDFNSGNQIRTYNAGKGVVCMLIYRSLLFAGCYDGMIYIFDTRTNNHISTINGPGEGMLLSLTIVNDLIIAGTKKDHLLKIWRIPEEILARDNT